MPSEDLHIRSFRVVFDLERRLHRIDRWRLPLPYGLPLRSIAYAVAAAATLMLLARVPVLGAGIQALPLPVRLVLLPATIAYGLTGIDIDGRRAHSGVASLARWALRPRRIAGTARTVPIGAVVLLESFEIAPDAAAGEALRPGTVRGAATVLLSRPATLDRRGRRLRVTATEDGWLEHPIEISYDGSRRVVIV